MNAAASGLYALLAASKVLSLGCSCHNVCVTFAVEKGEAVGEDVGVDNKEMASPLIEGDVWRAVGSDDMIEEEKHFHWSTGAG